MPADPKDLQPLYNDPSLTMLGVMILEVFLEESLESFLDRKGIKPEEALHFRALSALEQVEFFNLPPLFRRAIRACLTPATVDRAQNNAAKRLAFFNHVVAPLEAAAWEHFTALNPRNPDEAAALKYDLAKAIPLAMLQTSSFVAGQAAFGPTELTSHVHARQEDWHIRVSSSTCHSKYSARVVVCMCEYNI